MEAPPVSDDTFPQVVVERHTRDMRASHAHASNTTQAQGTHHPSTTNDDTHATTKPQQVPPTRNEHLDALAVVVSGLEAKVNSYEHTAGEASVSHTQTPDTANIGAQTQQRSFSGYTAKLIGLVDQLTSHLMEARQNNIAVANANAALRQDMTKCLSRLEVSDAAYHQLETRHQAMEERLSATEAKCAMFERALQGKARACVCLCVYTCAYSTSIYTQTCDNTHMHTCVRVQMFGYVCA